MTFEPVKPPTAAASTNGGPNLPQGGANDSPGLQAIVQALQLGGSPIGNRAEAESTLMMGPRKQINSLAGVDPKTRQKVQTPMQRILLEGLQPQGPHAGANTALPPNPLQPMKEGKI